MKCKCGADFEPLYHNGIIKSKMCVPCLIAKGKKKREALSRKETKELKEKIKTHSQWLNELQKVFNTYIRVRDKGQPCISCGKPYGQFTETAGHYFTTGAYPNLRFNEDNCHLQCWWNCNKNRHGNITEYTPNLIKKIGLERFNKLVEEKNKPLKLTTQEIKELIEIYKQKIKSVQVNP